MEKNMNVLDAIVEAYESDDRFERRTINGLAGAIGRSSEVVRANVLAHPEMFKEEVGKKTGKVYYRYMRP